VLNLGNFGIEKAAGIPGLQPYLKPWLHVKQNHFEIIVKLFQRHWTCWKNSWAAI